MNIEILRGIALSLCAATVAGLLSFLGLSAWAASSPAR